MHKLTPLVRGWKFFAGLLVVLVQGQLNGLDDLGRLVDSWLLVFALLGLGLVITAVASTLSWWNTAYRMHSGAIQYRKGVLFRQTRQAPLDRLQAVDVLQPLVGRLVGLSELRLEVAGGAGSDFRLAYLRDEDAQRVRRVLLAQAAGLSQPDDHQEAPEAPQQQIYELATSQLLLSTLLSPAVFTMAAGVLLTLALGIAVSLAAALAIFILPGCVGAVTVVWAAVSTRFGFTAAISPDGIRLRHGLLERRSQTVPPGRIQALEIRQPWLWRGHGWWLVQMNVAGYGKAGNEAKTATETVLLPAADLEQVALVVAVVLPEFAQPQWRLFLEQGLQIPGAQTPDADAYLPAPKQARWLDPLAWQRRGVLVTSRCLLARTGRWSRRLQIVPHERMQAVGLHQGPVQRRLGLASVRVFSTRGPVHPRADHLQHQDAAELVHSASQRARAARAVAMQQRWMQPADDQPR